MTPFYRRNRILEVTEEESFGFTSWGSLSQLNDAVLDRDSNSARSSSDFARRLPAVAGPASCDPSGGYPPYLGIFSLAALRVDTQ